ncbi:cilia- and flagella-associated protein 161-like [Diorhabda sublineata]|uniref:cilia- and flagella-associated protein 161-like n=1 Tax=Diorhabda sublineata TaxID=1163346 RepID=UPI0024E05EB3|nr:cilia- and flagella-associated protein 161-like [Diorhabda sublineata]
MWDEEMALREDKMRITAYKRDRCVINERDIDYIQHFKHGCGLSASPLKQPCVRNTFKIMGTRSNKEGQQVFFGEDVLLQICESSGPPLYIQCENSTMDSFGGHLSVRLSECPDIYCRFKFYHWNPQKRTKTNGTTFKPDTRVIIQHTASGRNLAFEPGQWMPTFYGPELQVSCHTYRDSHKMETIENFWKIVTRPLSDAALLVRAAKGENIPMDLFE